MISGSHTYWKTARKEWDRQSFVTVPGWEGEHQRRNVWLTGNSGVLAWKCTAWLDDGQKQTRNREPKSQPLISFFSIPLVHKQQTSKWSLQKRKWGEYILFPVTRIKSYSSVKNTSNVDFYWAFFLVYDVAQSLSRKPAFVSTAGKQIQNLFWNRFLYCLLKVCNRLLTIESRDYPLFCQTN